jgi:hypothetical protein
MAYHATEEDKGCFTGGLRTTRVQPFTWNADGTPRFGTPVGLDADLPAPGGDGTIAAQAEDAGAPVPRDRAAVVDDRRLFGYRGLRVVPAATPAHRLLTLRVHVARAGRYAVRLRVLGEPTAGAVVVTRPGGTTVTRSAHRAAPQPLDLALGTLTLKAGTTTWRLRSPAPLTLDQLRLERP